MSFKEGHYFSIANYSNESQFQNTIQSDTPRIDFSEVSSKKLADLWSETLEKGMHGICFSLYEDGQKPGDIITEEQVNNFCGNLLEVKGQENKNYIVMSKAAHNAFSPNQIQSLEKYGKIISSSLTVIENCGCGSARCMMAEVFLPKA